MTDLHTHILPGMDDGAPDPETSLAMLRIEAQHGVDTVALTPHFYRDIDTPEHFFRKRGSAFQMLRDAMEESGEDYPALILGAEVAWVPGMSQWEDLKSFCYADTAYLLVEPPFQHWSDTLLRELMELMNLRGITPVIAHLDRYLDHQRPERLNALYDLGLPVQISASALLERRTRRHAMNALKSGEAQLLISDCHNTGTRPPNLGPAMELLRKKLGARAETLFDETDELLLPMWSAI